MNEGEPLHTMNTMYCILLLLLLYPCEDRICMDTPLGLTPVLMLS